MGVESTLGDKTGNFWCIIGFERKKQDRVKNDFSFLDDRVDGCAIN